MPIDVAPPRDATGTVEAARLIHPALRDGDTAVIWGQLSYNIQQALGPQPNFDRVLGKILKGVGRLQECQNETGERVEALWVYRADCQFSKYPMRLVIGFDPDGMIEELRIERPASGPAPDRSAYQTKTPLALPFDGEWWVFWGGRTAQQNYHVASRDQRFATDLVAMRNGNTYHGTGDTNRDYYCWGESIFAPAAGRVVWLSKGVRDNRPGQLNPEEPLGNGLVLDHGNGEFSVLAHFQRRSLTVALDDEVAQGALLGRCGNSGNSSEPHLHYHLQDGPTPLRGDGFPAFFRDYRADGSPVELGEPVRGQVISRTK
jgi:hypothetical protein